MGWEITRLEVFLVIHSSPSHLASGTSTAVAKQRCSGGSDGACVMWHSGTEELSSRAGPRALKRNTEECAFSFCAECSIIWSESFLFKEWIITTSSFVIYTDSLAATQTCCFSVKGEWVSMAVFQYFIYKNRQQAGFELELPIFDYLWPTKSAASCGSMYQDS